MKARVLGVRPLPVPPLLCALCTLSAAHAAEPLSPAKIARESTRLKALVQELQKGANPAALAREFRKLADRGATRDIRREASFHLAALYRKHKNPGEAANLYDELSRTVAGPWGLRAAVALGDMRREADDLDAAVEAYERILRKNIMEPEAVRAALGVALVLEKRGDREGARKSLHYGRSVARQLYEDDRKSIADALKAIDAALRRLRPKRNPASPEAAKLLAWGNGELARKRYWKALGHYNKLLKDFPEAKEVDEAGHKRGLALYLCGKPEEARSAWGPFVEASPEGPWRGHALVGLGDIHLEYDFSYPKARSIYEIAEARLKTVTHESWRQAAPLIWERLGLCEYVAGRFDSASGWFGKASAARSHDPNRAGTGWPPEGQWLVDACKRREFPSPRHLLRQGSEGARLAVFLADAYLLAERHRKAAGIFERVHRGKIKGATQHQRAYACARHGWCHYQLFEWDEAKRILADVEKLYLPTPEARRGLIYLANILCAHCKFHKEDEVEMVRLLKVVTGRWPNTEEGAKAQMVLAIHLADEKRYGEALLATSEFLRRYPNHWGAGWFREHHIPAVQEGLGKIK